MSLPLFAEFAWRFQVLYDGLLSDSHEQIRLIKLVLEKYRGQLEDDQEIFEEMLCRYECGELVVAPKSVERWLLRLIEQRVSPVLFHHFKRYIFQLVAAIKPGVFGDADIDELTRLSLDLDVPDDSSVPYAPAESIFFARQEALLCESLEGESTEELPEDCEVGGLNDTCWSEEILSQ